VQIYTKFKQPKPKKRPSGGHWGWGVLVVLLVFGAWWRWVRVEPAKPAGPVVTPETARLPAFQPTATNPPLPVTVVTNPPRPAVGAHLPLTNRVASLTPTNRVPVMEPVIDNSVFPRLPRDSFEVQVALARAGISAGSFDGVVGSQTRAAVRVFQLREGLAETGAADAETKVRLQLTQPPLTNYVVSANDLARLQPLGTTWLGKSQQSALDYETVLELAAEKGHAHPLYIKRLNPAVDWTNVTAGASLRIPNVSYPPPRAKAAFLLIHLAGKTLQAFDANTNLLAHFPCSIAARVEKRPVGELRVAVVAPNPNYTFDPEVFPESPEAQKLGRKLILPPGPNNPVGVAWIGLDRSGYGIHGTPAPEAVGRTESHGCFRLANWNAEYLVRLVTVGTPVRVVE
jgi:lipoprotein-anchoring transpeptidase ErfK/SrfK